MIPNHLTRTAARLMAWHQDVESCALEDVPSDPEACLWLLQVPQSGAVLLENWTTAIRIVSAMAWISSPFLTTDERGCPELQLVVAPSERRAVLRCISRISETIPVLLLGEVVSAWQAAARGIDSKRHVTGTTNDSIRDRGDD